MEHIMNIIRRTLLATLFAIAFSSSVYAIPPDITGNYRCNGYDPYGKISYTNPITITQVNNVYNFQWLATSGNSLILGTGLFNKNVDTVLSVVFWDPKEPSYFGTEIFQILPDGTLNANWVLQGHNLIGSESCTFTQVE
jgi:hypothetical protein